MPPFTSLLKRAFPASGRFGLVCAVCLSLLLLSTGCNITKSIDDVINEIESVKQTVESESTA